jgi:hypothetical protein
MDKTQISIKEFVEAKEGDILVFDGKKWKPATPDEFFKNIEKQMMILNAQFATLNLTTLETVNKFKKVLEEQRLQIAEVLKGLVK